MAKRATSGKKAGDASETDPAAPKKAKRRANVHSLKAPTHGLAAYALCGAYTLTTKQTAERDEVGCRECRRLLVLS